MQINLKTQSEMNNFSFDILCNQYASVGIDWNCENVSSFYSRLYYIESGYGRLVYNGNETPLLPGNIYFIPAGTCFSYHCTDETSMKKLYFHITLMANEYYDILSNIEKGIYTITLEEANAQNIFETYQKDDYISLLTVKTIVYNTILAFYSKYNWDKKDIRKNSQIVSDVISYIQKNLKVKLTLKEIADELFLSASTISKIFKSETGISIGTYIDNLLFTKAHHLMLQKEYTIRDISTELGFCDQFYFSRRFKEKFGKSPQQYRKSEIKF